MADPLKLVAVPMQKPNRELIECVAEFEQTVAIEVTAGAEYHGYPFVMEIDGVKHLAQAFTVSSPPARPGRPQGNTQGRGRGEVTRPRRGAV